MSSLKHVLMTGGSGQVGRELLSLAWPDDVRILAPTRMVLNLADEVSIQRYLDRVSLSAIVSCGAYTAVDKAESDTETAWAVNAVSPAILAAAARRRGIPILHVSTDYVFDGSKSRPYTESDPVSPTCVYGASKVGGEEGVRKACADHVILRTSWVCSAHRRNFLETMLRLGSQQKELRIVDDQLGTPTMGSDLAAAMQTIILRMIDGAPVEFGTYHFSNAGEATWFDLALEIFRQSKALGGPNPRIIPITTSEFPTVARRPPDSRLDCARICATFGIDPQPWDLALTAPLTQILAQRLCTAS